MRNTNPAGTPTSSAASLSVVLSFLCRLGEGNRAGERRGSYINKVIRYISDNLSHVMTADDISGEFFVSRAKLSADFKRETGMTLKQYVCLQTIERARTMLSDRRAFGDRDRARLPGLRRLHPHLQKNDRHNPRNLRRGTCEGIKRREKNQYHINQQLPIFPQTCMDDN